MPVIGHNSESVPSNYQPQSALAIHLSLLLPSLFDHPVGHFTRSKRLYMAK